MDQLSTELASQILKAQTKLQSYIDQQVQLKNEISQVQIQTKQQLSDVERQM